MLTNFTQNFYLESFPSIILDTFKLMTLDKTYLPTDFFSTTELRRLRFCNSGLTNYYDYHKKKMVLSTIFLLRSFIPEVLTNPYIYFTDIEINSEKRL